MKYTWMSAGPVTLEQYVCVKSFVHDAIWQPKAFDGHPAIIVVNDGTYPQFEVEDVFFTPYGVSKQVRNPSNDWERMAAKLLEVVYASS